MYICIYIYIYTLQDLHPREAASFFIPGEVAAKDKQQLRRGLGVLPSLTVPQKGNAKRGSKKRLGLSDSTVVFVI